MDSAPAPTLLTARLADFAASTRLDDLPARAVETAKVILLDTFGVCLAAAPLPIGRILARHALDSGSRPEATLIGWGAKVAAPQAALVNGALANALDFNESSHVATHVMPAALALAERDGRSGRDFLEAFVVGFEGGYRLAQVFDGARVQSSGPTYRGWWHVGVLAPLAGSLAASRLLGLDARRTAMALGIASCSAGGFRRNMGTMAKAYHSGHGAADGIQAALLAERGFTGDGEIIEAPLGFLAALCNAGEHDDAAIAERLGNPFVLEGKPRIKPFPSCTRSHKGIDAALAVHARGGYWIEDIVAIQADLNSFSLLRPEAEDEDAAGFSAPFLIASALVHGALGLDQISPEGVHNPGVRALMPLVSDLPAAKGVEAVVVRLKDGRELRGECPAVRRLEDRGDMDAKYRDAAARSLKAEVAEELRDLLLAVEHQPDLGRIMSLASGAD
jgi:2-methylcitrate dehydratase PrpD